MFPAGAGRFFSHRDEAFEMRHNTVQKYLEIVDLQLMTASCQLSSFLETESPRTRDISRGTITLLRATPCRSILKKKSHLTIPGMIEREHSRHHCNCGKEPILAGQARIARKGRNHEVAKAFSAGPRAPTSSTHSTVREHFNFFH